MSHVAAENIAALVKRQRQFFHTQTTLPLDFRKEQLVALRSGLKKYEAEFFAALSKDLGKPALETWLSEYQVCLHEVHLMLTNLDRWAKPQRVSTPWLLWPAKSAIHLEPVGCVLVIAPWNYPLQLSLMPLIGAMAAGNCVILKPSPLAPACSQFLTKLVSSCLAEHYVSVVEGDIPETQALLRERFDHIFFTGGPKVAKIVAAAAAVHLTPVTLELGGKSPCLIDDDVDMAVAARRVIWGKFFNTGQTCVAPDYVLVSKARQDEFLKHAQAALKDFFGGDPRQSGDYGRIVSREHLQRLQGMLQRHQVVAGGEVDAETKYFAPTILRDVSFGDPVMAEEIFGPILPVLTYETFDAAVDEIRARPKPLALYCFTNRADVWQRVCRDVSFGGGCLNDTLVHVNNPDLPFGGVGDSGVGAYHGHHSFVTFSHRKSVVTNTLRLDVPVRYPPYGNKLRWLRKILG